MPRPARVMVLAWLATALVLPVLSPTAVSGQPDPEALFRTRLSSASSSSSQGDQAGTPSIGVALNMETVGQHNIGGRGFNADVWVHGTYAYVGQWGFGDPQHPDRCPSGIRAGVKVFDVSNPANPILVSTLVNPAQTSAEDVQVLRYTVGPLAGRDIAMVGIQACFRSNLAIPRGLQLFDVTDPRNPQVLGFLNTGPAIGVHEFWAVQRADGVFALLAVPFSMFRDDRVPKRGDVRIVNVTDPRNPVEIADWSAEGVLGFGTFDGFGCFPFVFAHGATSNAAGTLAVISHWDLGNVFLDIANPAAPQYLGRTGYPPNSEGDAHSAELTEDEQFLLTADEVIPPNSNCQAPDRRQQDAWGFLRVFDVSSPAAPIQVGQYKTPNSASPNRMRKGDYSIHNPWVADDRAYLSWYSDGVRAVNISDPRNPAEIGFLVPPAVKDPLRLLGFVPEVWGVVSDDRGCIFLSEMNFGLYVVRETLSTTCR